VSGDEKLLYFFRFFPKFLVYKIAIVS